VVDVLDEVELWLVEVLWLVLELVELIEVEELVDDIDVEVLVEDEVEVVVPPLAV